MRHKRLIGVLLSTIIALSNFSVYAGLTWSGSDAKDTKYVDIQLQTPNLGKYRFDITAKEKPSGKMISTVRNNTDYFPVTIKSVIKEVDNNAPTAVYSKTKKGKVDIVFATGQMKDTNVYTDSMDTFKSKMTAIKSELDAEIQTVKTSSLESLNSIKWTECIGQGASKKISSFKTEDNGLTLSIQGNYSDPGISTFYTIYNNGLVRSEFSVDYALNFGDSMSTTGIILNGKENSDDTMDYYAIVFAHYESTLADDIQKLKFSDNEMASIAIVKFKNVKKSDGGGTRDYYNNFDRLYYTNESNAICKRDGGYEIVCAIKAPTSGNLQCKVEKGQITVEVTNNIVKYINYITNGKAYYIDKSSNSSDDTQYELPYPNTIIADKYEDSNRGNSKDTSKPKNYIGYRHIGWMLGFFSEHYQHACERYGLFKLTNIHVENLEGKSLSDALSDVSWRDGAARIIINSSDVEPEDLKYIHYINKDIDKDKYNDDYYLSQYIATTQRITNSDAYLINLGSDASIGGEDSVSIYRYLLQQLRFGLNGKLYNNGVNLDTICSNIKTNIKNGCIVDTTGRITSENIGSLWDDVIEIIKAVVLGRNKGPEDWYLVDTEIEWNTEYDDPEHDIPLNIGSIQHESEWRNTYYETDVEFGLTGQNKWFSDFDRYQNKLIEQPYKRVNIDFEKWRYSHNKDFFENVSSLYENSGIWINAPENVFHTAGLYRVNYKRKDNPLDNVDLNDAFNSYRKWSDNYDYSATTNKVGEQS